MTIKGLLLPLLDCIIGSSSSPFSVTYVLCYVTTVPFHWRVWIYFLNLWLWIDHVTCSLVPLHLMRGNFPGHLLSPEQDEREVEQKHSSWVQPKSVKVWEMINKCCFKPLSFGVDCYAPRDPQILFQVTFSCKAHVCLNFIGLLDPTTFFELSALPATGNTLPFSSLSFKTLSHSSRSS